MNLHSLRNEFEVSQGLSGKTQHTTKMLPELCRFKGERNTEFKVQFIYMPYKAWIIPEFYDILFNRRKGMVFV